MPCLLCAAATRSYFPYGKFIHLPYGLFRCAACGLVQTEPMPSSEFLKDWYQRYDVLGEREPYYHGVMVDDPWSTMDGREAGERFEMAQRVVDGSLSMTHGFPIRVLEIGSGHGLFLALVKQAGWHGVGVELNQRAADVSRERFDLEVRQGTIESVELAPLSFEVITLWDIFEHVNDPRGLLSLAHDLLVPAGLLILETPNLSSLLDKTVMALARIGITGPARTFYGLHHLTLWNPKTIRCILRETGFELKEILFVSTPAVRVFRGGGLRDIIGRWAVDAAQGLGRLLKRQNKMMVVAQKIL
ncbi:class I SAM-dependent methyltransferase [Candidatus Uhrbacteria bacterium]|nr:class I SAM-dependent methyltransferase [Candidatus Uhrbacteria bacterium]